MMQQTGFAVVGCPKCRRIMAADLSHAVKTCQCGNRLNLAKIKYLAVFASGEEAAAAVQKFQEQKNTGFESASGFGK